MEKVCTVLFSPSASLLASSLPWVLFLPPFALCLPPPHPPAPQNQLGTSSGACSVVPPHLTDPASGWVACCIWFHCGSSYHWRTSIMP